MPFHSPPGLSALAAATALALGLTGCGSSSHHNTRQDATTAQAATTTGGHTATTPTTTKAAKRPQTGKRTATKAASHGSGPSAAPSPPPAGLRATGGYRMYELCSGHCTGSVPAALERPLHLPAAPPSGCPASTVKGPVRPQRSPDVKLEQFVASSWEGAEVTWEAAASYHGPVLIRGRQLGGASPVGFGEGHVPYDQLQLLDAAQGMPRGPTRKWPSFTRVHGPGCYAYQVDGAKFSEVIVFRAS